MIELTIQDSSEKSRLMAKGKKKLTHVLTAKGIVVEDEGTYKVALKVEGPDKSVAEDLLGTVKLGEKVEAEFTPTSPE